MVSRAELANLSERAKRTEDRLMGNEEATKHALVLPFFTALGYDVFDPEEVVPEYTADYGLKRGEKVDYAIIRGGAPILIVECKPVGDQLKVSRASQLARYFHSTDTRLGLLTNGIEYQFYSDLDESNKMDKTPFLTVNLTILDERNLVALEHFTKRAFNLDAALSVASNLRYINGIKDYLNLMYAKPDPDFIRLVTKDVFTGSMTQARREEFEPLVKMAMHGFVNDRINTTLKLASNLVNTPEQHDSEIDDAAEDDDAGEDAPAMERDIITTAEELRGLDLVRTMLGDVVDPERIVIRDTKSYCGIILDDNRRLPICRLVIRDGGGVKLSWPTGERGAKNSTVFASRDLDDLDDIVGYQGEMLAVLQRYIAPNLDG